MRTEDQVRSMACLVQQSVEQWRRKGVSDAPKTMLEQAAFEQGRLRSEMGAGIATGFDRCLVSLRFLFQSKIHEPAYRL